MDANDNSMIMIVTLETLCEVKNFWTNLNNLSYHFLGQKSATVYFFWQQSRFSYYQFDNKIKR